MNTAPEWGAGFQNEKGPRRQPPAKAHNKSTRDSGLYSAPALQNQPLKTVGIWQTREAFGSGNVVYATTEEEDHADLAQLKAAGARAGHTLAQLRLLLRHRGLKHPPPELQEAWLRIGVAQYAAISASRPRWTFGLHNWVRRYLPAVWASWPAEQIERLARQVRREGVWFSPAEKGAMVGVTRDEYHALNLSELWPVGMTREEREDDQRQAKNAKARADNLASGKVKNPHSQSITRLQPWLKLEIKERTYWRWKAQGKLPQAD